MISKVPKINVMLAFAAVYVIWGSTYLAIRIAVESMPPLLMVGVRFLVAGCFFYLWARHQGVKAPSRSQWLATGIAGILMAGCGTGGVSWGEQYVPSGLTALLVASAPLWMVLFDWLRPRGVRPGWLIVAGLVVGFGGVTMLIKPDAMIFNAEGYTIGAFVILGGALAGAFGSIYSRQADLPDSRMLTTGMIMLAGGSAAALAGSLFGEWNQLIVSDIALEAWLALLYLIVAGSVGFASYNWLLRETLPARVATYAYVNPVIAMLLGTWLLEEAFTLRIAVAMLVIIAAVVAIIGCRDRRDINRTTVSCTPCHEGAVPQPVLPNNLLDKR